MRRLAVILLALVVTSCAVDAQQHADVANDVAVPFGLLDSSAPPLLPPATAAPAESVAVCFVKDNVLAVVPVNLAPPVQLDDVVATLAQPPANAASLRTAVGDPPMVHTVNLKGGIARVDLEPSVSDLGGRDQLLAVAQLVCTLTGQPGVGQVSFTLDGAPVEVPRGDGSLTDGPVSRGDYAALIG
jgi:spore germination protein GerM